MDDDPSAIRSLAVSTEDVVDAFVYTQSNPGRAVLRVTPPFHGRMRARLHVSHETMGTAAHETDAIHIQPRALLTSAVVDDYPALEAIEAQLADGESAATPAAIRDAHADALAEWRERAADSVVETVVLETDAESTRVDVTAMT